jgi:uncharacterized protein YraI
MQQRRQVLIALALMIGLAGPSWLGAAHAQQVGTIVTPTAENTAAQQPADGLGNFGDLGGRVISSNWQALDATVAHTYHFDYAGNNQPVRVWINMAPEGGARFDIWTVDGFAAANAGAGGQPVASGAPLEGQGVPGSLFWQGAGQTPESYLVIITSQSEGEVQYILNIAGPGLAPAQTSQPTQVGPTDQISQTVQIEQVGQATPTPAANPNIATVIPAALNVRTGPSPAYEVIRAVARGTQLAVIGRNATNSWLAVTLDDGRQGWVSRTLTDFTGVPNAVMTPAPDAAATTPAAGGSEAPAAGEDDPGTNANSGQALDANWRLLRPGENHWYTFQVRGGQLPVHLWMDVEPSNGAAFSVFNESDAQAIMAGANRADFAAVGSGTADPAGYLFWPGVFAEAGTFYVLVEPSAQGDVHYSIYAAGSGLARPAP